MMIGKILTNLWSRAFSITFILLLPKASSWDSPSQSSPSLHLFSAPIWVRFLYCIPSRATVLDLFHSRVPGEMAVPIVDFSRLRDLGCTITDSFDNGVAAEILGHSEKLEVLCATSMCLLCIRSRRNLYNSSRWITWPTWLILLAKPPFSDDLQKSKHQLHPEERKLGSIARTLWGAQILGRYSCLGRNHSRLCPNCVINDSKRSRKLGSSKEWSRLSEVLRNGFPELKRFSTDINVVITAAPIPRGVKKLIIAWEPFLIDNYVGCRTVPIWTFTSLLY